METVEDKTDVGMICPADHLPRIAVVVDVAAPGQRLVAYAHAPIRRDGAQLGKVVRRPVDPAKRLRMA